MRYAITVTQTLAETIIVDEVDTEEEAISITQKYDQNEGVDPQEIVDVNYSISKIPADDISLKYALVITPDHVKEEN